jgi:nicotinamidase-related amidase
VFIYQAFEKWTPKSFFVTWVPVKGSYKAQIDSRINKETNDPEFNKPYQDAFSNPELQTYLNNRKIGTLFVSGGAAEACVYMTVWGARNRGYQVYVIDEAIYSFSPAKKNEIYSKYKDIGATILSIKDLPSLLNDSAPKARDNGQGPWLSLRP